MPDSTMIELAQPQTTTVAPPVRLDVPGAAFVIGSPRFVEPELAGIATRDGIVAAWTEAFRNS